MRLIQEFCYLVREYCNLLYKFAQMAVEKSDEKPEIKKQKKVIDRLL